SMPIATEYATQEPTRAEVEAIPGPVLLEFGTGWGGYCRAPQPDLAGALGRHPHGRHLKIEDGPGRPPGPPVRWQPGPAPVFLKDGQAVQQVSRPGPDEVRAGLEAIDPAG